jgi:hypothetical protein
MTTTLVVCAGCGATVEKHNNQINLAHKRAKRLFCSKSCAARTSREEYRKTYTTPAEKACLCCHAVKPLACFDSRTGNLDGRFSECKDCRSVRSKARRVRERDKLNALQKKARYGLTPEMEAAILVDQGGVCGLCGGPPPLVVDHCHKTKMVRGLLCSRCNRGLGMLGDDVDGLLRALTYLSRKTPGKDR